MPSPKKFGLVAVALSVAMFSTCNHASAQFGGLFSGGAEIETIDTKALNGLLTKQKKLVDRAEQDSLPIPKANFVLVDVRSEQEVNVSVIPGAITKSMYEKDDARYQGKLVIAYCTVGGRSGAYAKQLTRKGVKVQNYKGSILKWVDAGLPLVTLDGRPTNRVHTYSDRYRIPDKYEQVTE